jgi:predicted ATP-grasp superfamily ATP-dependent carboligase
MGSNQSAGENQSDTAHADTQDEERAEFLELAARADFSLIVAPESDGTLGARCTWVEEVGGRLLGPSAAAVQLTADKLTLYSHWLQHGILTPETHLFRPGKAVPASFFPLVWKPRDGAGSQTTFLVEHPDQLENRAALSQNAGRVQAAIVQRFVPGIAASVSFLVGLDTQLPLMPSLQYLSKDRQFRYLGGRVPLPRPLAERAIQLADRAIAVVCGLKGYVGVDLVLGSAADGSQDWVIEINPRLTTSYVGLRALAQTNLAAAMLEIATSSRVPDISWRPGTVEFKPDGTSTLLSHESA